MKQDLFRIPQDVFLFSDSIGRNIAFGQGDADDQKVRQAAHDAGVREDIGV